METITPVINDYLSFVKDKVKLDAEYTCADKMFFFGFITHAMMSGRLSPVGYVAIKAMLAIMNDITNLDGKKAIEFIEQVGKTSSRLSKTA